MQKKKFADISNALVVALLAKANNAEAQGPLLEEEEARMLVGIHLKKNADQIVDTILGRAMVFKNDEGDVVAVAS